MTYFKGPCTKFEVELMLFFVHFGCDLTYVPLQILCKVPLIWYYDYEKYSLSKSCNKKLLKCLEVAKWVVIMCIRFINEKNTFSVFRRTVGLIRIFALKNTSYTHFSFIFSVFRRTVGRIRSLFWNILKHYLPQSQNPRVLLLKYSTPSVDITSLKWVDFVNFWARTKSPMASKIIKAC